MSWERQIGVGGGSGYGRRGQGWPRQHVVEGCEQKDFKKKPVDQ